MSPGSAFNADTSPVGGGSQLSPPNSISVAERKEGGEGGPINISLESRSSTDGESL